MTKNIDVSTSIGSIKGLPPQLLGWFGLAIIAGYLVWNVASQASTQHDTLIELTRRQVSAIERLVDRIDRLPNRPGPGGLGSSLPQP